MPFIPRIATPQGDRAPFIARFEKSMSRRPAGADWFRPMSGPSRAHGFLGGFLRLVGDHRSLFRNFAAILMKHPPFYVDRSVAGLRHAGRCMQIFLIDDDAHVRRTLAKLLRTCGFAILGEADN